MELIQGKRNSILPRFSLPTNSKKEPGVGRLGIRDYLVRVESHRKEQARKEALRRGKQPEAICDPRREMQSQQEGKKGYEQVEADQYGVALLKLIQKFIVGVEESLHQKMAIVMVERTLYTFFQKMSTLKNNYKSQFDAYVMVLGAYCGGVSVPQILVDTKLKELYPSATHVSTANGDQRTAAEVPAREHYLACIMLVWENAVRFGEMKDDCFNRYLLGGDNYPKTREDVVGLLNNYKDPKKQHQNYKWGVKEELAFVQNGEEEKKLNTMEGTKWHVCNK